MQNSAPRVSTLDLARGLAALTVCAGHLRAAIFVDYVQLDTSSLLQKIFYGVTGFGHEAVMVFFVLSGYFVGGSVIKQSDNFEWIKYAVTRLTRLWVVLIPALLLTVIVDQIIQTFHPEVFSGAYSEMWASGPLKEEFSRGVSVLVGNILFQQTVFVPVFGTNSPLWSLSNEFYYYILLPVFLFSGGYVGNREKFGLRLFFGLFCLIALALLPNGFAEGFLVFCMGAMVNWFKTREVESNQRRSTSMLMLLGSILFLFALYVSRASISRGFFSRDIFIGVGFSLLLVPLADVHLPLALFRKLTAFVADISYSLYLTHFPLVLLLASTYYGKNQIKPDFMGILILIFWLAFMLLMAALFWFSFERHTGLIRVKTLALLGVRREVGR